MTWTPQPEHTPEQMRPGGRVAGVLVCAFHATTCQGLVAAHGSVEGVARRVAQTAAQCRDCIREQREDADA